MANPRVFWDMKMGGYQVGRVVIEVYADIVPKTAENFITLCTGEKGFGYEGSPFSKIYTSGVDNGLFDGGDFNGTGGHSIWGGTFADENYRVKPDQPFMLSMSTQERHTNGSKFYIWPQGSSNLQDRYVFFGQVVDGSDVLLRILSEAGDNNGTPKKSVVIADCGQL